MQLIQMPACNILCRCYTGLEADDDAGSAAAAARSERRVPGELLEVVVEKLLAAGALDVMLRNNR
jgi:hypothetical protein